MTPGAWNRQPRTLVGLLILAFTTTLIAASPRPATPSDQLAAFIDEFVAADQEDRAGELSAESFQSRLDRIDGWLEDLRGIDRGGLGVQEEIDWRFAESILMGRKIELEHIRSWRRDPRVYMRFRDLNVAIDKPGEPQGKVDEVVDVLERTSAQLDNGRRNLTVYVPRFQELSVYMAEGARQIFTEKVPEFARSVPERSDEILRANGEARDSLESFLTFLNEELPDRPEGTFAIGEDSYDMMLEHQYLLDYDSAGLFDYGREQYDKTVRDLQRVAEEIDPDKSWRELAEEIKRDYPDPRQMIEAHQEWVDKAKKHIVDNDLVPIPWDERVEVVPRPEYLRKTSYYGNFSGAREKNDEGVYLSRWQINPFEDQWDEETKREYLVEHDWGVIIVTAPHETYAGHHVQGLYQMQNPRKLRREYGISIFSEGWGLYNEELMQETGFFPDERIHLRQLQLKLWRNARVVWDVGIHTGRMSYDEGVSLLADGVGFLRWAAQLEIDGSAQRPGYRIGYFMGMSEIKKMRQEFKERVGDDFTLRDFHERLLEVGNMPPALMRAGLMASVDEG